VRKVSRAQEQHEEINFRSASIVEANQYIKKQGDSWVIVQKGTGKVLSHHDSEAKAEASFAAMMMNKHGSVDDAGITTAGYVEPERQRTESLEESRTEATRHHDDLSRQWAATTKLVTDLGSGGDRDAHYRAVDSLFDQLATEHQDSFRGLCGRCTPIKSRFQMSSDGGNPGTGQRFVDGGNPGTGQRFVDGGHPGPGPK